MILLFMILAIFSVMAGGGIYALLITMRNDDGQETDMGHPEAGSGGEEVREGKE